MKVYSVEKRKRLANVELLRIISMILVLLVHYNFPLNGKLSLEMFQESLPKYIGVAGCFLSYFK